MRSAAEPHVQDCQALRSFKQAVAEDMRSQRDRERLDRPNPNWFGIRVACVLMDPPTKSFFFEGDSATAATARSSALDIVGWMAARELVASSGEPAPRGQCEAGQPKKRRTFLSSLRAFASDGDVSGGGPGWAEAGGVLFID